jgi:hypothetical protein
MIAVTLLLVAAGAWELAHGSPARALMYAGWAVANVGIVPT